MHPNDIIDAFHVILNIADSTDVNFDKVSKKWDESLSKSRLEYIDLSTALKVRKTDQGREVALEHLNNPVIIGKTRNGNLISLDGSHRLKNHIKNCNEKIPAFIVDISWLEDADDMSYDN